MSAVHTTTARTVTEVHSEMVSVLDVYAHFLPGYREDGVVEENATGLFSLLTKICVYPDLVNDPAVLRELHNRAALARLNAVVG